MRHALTPVFFVLLIMMLGSSSAIASSSFSSTVRAFDDDDWAAYSGARLYSEDDKTYLLTLDNCEFELDAFARTTDERAWLDEIKKAARWITSRTNVQVMLTAIARPRRRINVFTVKDYGLCDFDRTTLLAIGRGSDIIEHVRTRSGRRDVNADIGIILGQVRRLPNGKLWSSKRQDIVFTTDWFTPKQEERAWDYANAITLGLIRILSKRK